MAGRTIRVDQQRIGHLPGRYPCQKNRGKSTSRRSHVGCLALIKSARHQKELSAISIKSNVHFTRNRFAIDTDQSVAGRHVGLGYEVVTLQHLCPDPPRDFVTTKRRFCPEPSGWLEEQFATRCPERIGVGRSHTQGRGNAGREHRDELRLEAQLKKHRSEVNTSEIQTLMRNRYAVFCCKNKINT